uniref:Uncharacterized protein n=1 Tax=Arundo donax TaxID=35708 RepID=A0A0A9BSQ1_ARUDO
MRATDRVGRVEPNLIG